MEQQINQASTEPKLTGAGGESYEGAEAQIKAVVAGINEAFRKGDLDKIMSFYANDVVAYDMVPPLAYKGVESYRKAWQMGLDMMAETGPLETAEEKIYVSQDLAVYHGLCHMNGTLKKDNKKIDSWSRYTGVFKKLNGKWLVVHEQFSVPIDMESEKAQWDLKPGGKEMMQ